MHAICLVTVRVHDSLCVLMQALYVLMHASEVAINMTWRQVLQPAVLSGAITTTNTLSFNPRRQTARSRHNPPLLLVPLGQLAAPPP